MLKGYTCKDVLLAKLDNIKSNNKYFLWVRQNLLDYATTDQV